MFDVIGDALITIATGELTDADADTLGLVPKHAYAVLGKTEIVLLATE